MATPLQTWLSSLQTCLLQRPVLGKHQRHKQLSAATLPLSLLESRDCAKIALKTLRNSTTDQPLSLLSGECADGQYCEHLLPQVLVEMITLPTVCLLSSSVVALFLEKHSRCLS